MIKKTRYLLPASVVLLVVTGGIAIALFSSTNSDEIVTCRDDKVLMEKVGNALKTNDYVALDQLVSDITLRDDYQLDANCIYPNVVFYIKAGNIEESNSYLALLRSVSNDTAAYSELIQEHVKTVDQLQQDITFLENAASNIENNTIYFSGDE